MKRDEILALAIDVFDAIEDRGVRLTPNARTAVEATLLSRLVDRSPGPPPAGPVTLSEEAATELRQHLDMVREEVGAYLLQLPMDARTSPRVWRAALRRAKAILDGAQRDAPPPDAAQLPALPAQRPAAAR